MHVVKDIFRPTEVVQGGTASRRWEVATRAVRPDLEPYIRDHMGYRETTPGPLIRREFPGPLVVVIFEMGPPIRVFEKNDTERASRYPGGFVAGVHDGFTLTEHEGSQYGLQMNLTPIGARRLFGLSMSELTNQVVSLRDVLPKRDRSLPEQLEELRDWASRFDRIERWVDQQLSDSDLPSEVVAWAVRKIHADGGGTDMRALCRDLGYSQKHVIRLFKAHVGVPPKLLARIVRFDRLAERLRSGDQSSWTQLAAEFGYYDQAHLVRDVRQFTGLPPRRARAELVGFTDPET